MNITEFIPHNDPSPSGVLVMNLNAIPLYERARHRGTLHHFISALTGKSRELLCLDSHIAESAVRNTQMPITQVSINQILGSVNRVREFDRDFYPLTNSVQTRWLKIASMMLQGAPLPPVELIRVDDIYFVVDGHHRISVSRMLGHLYVDALVQTAER